MARDLSEAVEILKEHGLDFVQIVQDTHAETMLRIGTLLDESLELVIKGHAIKTARKELDEKLFRKYGKLETLRAKIKRAKSDGLLDAVTHSDADVIREIRNEFGHLKTKLHFNSPAVVALTSKLSTYDATLSTQNVIFAANIRVLDRLKAAMKQTPTLHRRCDDVASDTLFRVQRQLENLKRNG